MMLVRLGSSAAANVFIVICLRHLPLATFNTVLQVTPLAVTAGAALVFRERVSLQRWAAALTGRSCADCAPRRGKLRGWRLLRADRIAVYDYSGI
jgi:hypothetical protein